MEHPMLSRKRRLLHGREKDPLLYTKKCASSLILLQDRCWTHSCARATEQARLQTCCGHICPREPWVDAEFKHYAINRCFFLSWADTQYCVKRVLERFQFRPAADNSFLNEQVNKKFLQFHSDITEECGAEEKQHSWAVIEKQEEVVMYGPYYPNYSKGEHSEDVVIRQTQELLESDEPSEDWKVYVFTVNSPCLARKTERGSACMLNLVQKAQKWWTGYGVKTHIGYVRCWGFKGTKENLFRDIDYSQVECIKQTKDHEEYVKAAEERADLNPLPKHLSSAVKHLLTSVNVSFPLIANVQGQDWKSYFKKMQSIFESKPEEEREIITKELNAAIEGAQGLLSRESASFEEHLESGKTFHLDHAFSLQVSDSLQEQLRLTFQQCWREMVQDRYAELIREQLTEDFNRWVVQFFIQDIPKFTNEYLQIGKIRF